MPVGGAEFWGPELFGEALGGAELFGGGEALGALGGDALFGGAEALGAGEGVAALGGEAYGGSALGAGAPAGMPEIFAQSAGDALLPGSGAGTSGFESLAGSPAGAANFGTVGLDNLPAGGVTGGGDTGGGGATPSGTIPVAGGAPGETMLAPPGTAPSAMAPPTPTPGAPPAQLGATSPSVSGLPVGTGGADVPLASQSAGAIPGAEGVAEGGGLPQGAAQTGATGSGEVAGGGLPTTPPANLFKKGIDAITNNPLQAGALGLNAASQLAQRNSANQLPAQLKEAAKPASDAASQLLGQGLSGTAPQAVVQQANDTLTSTVEQIKQRYAAMGRDPSKDSAAQQEIAKATQQRDAAIFNASQTLLQEGLTAAGLAQGPVVQAATAGAQQDKELSASMSNMMQQMAMLQALQAGQNKGTAT